MAPNRIQAGILLAIPQGTHLVLVEMQLNNFDGGAVWHDPKLVAKRDSALLDLALHHSTEVFVFGKNG